MDPKAILNRIDRRLAALDLKETRASQMAGKPDAIRNLRRRVASGGKAGVTTETIAALAPVLQTTEGWLLTGAQSDYSNQTQTEHKTLDLGPPQSLNLQPAPAFSDQPMPVLGKAVGGEDGKFMFNGEVVEYVNRPEKLDKVKGAYGLYVDGESMEPRYYAGELIYVHPGKSPKRGDYVVIELKGHDGVPGAAYIKRYEREAGNRVVVSQLNPPKELEFQKDNLRNIHVIVGSFTG